MNASPGSRDLGGFKSIEAERKYAAAYDKVLAQWPVPFTQMTVNTPFAETHVIVSGPEDSAPVVLLHATGMSSTVWLPNIGALSRRHRTFAVDIANEPGRTQQTRLLRDPNDCAGWLSGVLEGLGIPRVSFVGSSFGGWLAINFALQAPARVDRLILLAPAASLLPFSLPTYLLLRSLPYLPLKLSAKRMLGMFLPGSEVDAQFARQFELGVHGFRYANPRKSVFPRPYNDEQLFTLAVPTLLLIGDQERIYNPRKALDRASRLIPTIDAKLIAGAGHILAMQKPDTINAEVVTFLERPARY